jgi:hypothetical protein
MNIGLQIKPITGEGAVNVGSLVKLEILAEGEFGAQAESWIIDEAEKNPNGIFGSGSLTLFGSKATQLAPTGGFTKIEIPGMVHGLGALTVGPFTLRHKTGATIAVPVSDLRTSIAAPQEKVEPQWFLPLAPIGGWNWFLLALLTAIPLLLFGLYFWLRRRWKKSKLWTEQNPAEAAVAELQELEKTVRKKMPRSEAEWKSFSFRLTSLLKRYAGARYSFPSVDLTDRELLEELKRFPSVSVATEVLSKILKELDEVRYGQRTLDLNRAPALVGEALRFVNLTPARIQAKP